MKYFAAISKRADELTVLGQEYLDALPFMSNEDVGQKIWDKAIEIDESDGENPEWVDEALDGFIPYYGVPRNGSIYFSLGFSPTAQDALLRNFMEHLLNQTEELKFPCLAEKDIVSSYTTD